MPQLTRPTSDISTGGWTTDAGATSNLFQAIDESTSSDTDYVRSDQTSNPDEYVIGLRPFADPGVNTGHTFRIRERKDSAGGETTDIDAIVMAGTWEVHTESYDDTDQTINAHSVTLTSAEVDEFRANGGYADPRIKLRRRKRQTITTSTGVTYTTSPTSLTCDIRRPSSGGPFPVVVMVVDGGFQTNDFTEAQPGAIRLSQEEGFATIIPQVRTAPTNLCPAPMEDMGDMIDFVVANAGTYNLDANKIAFMGGSGGGYVACYGALGTQLTAGQLARVKCAVGASPPTDLRNAVPDGSADPPMTTILEQFLGATEAANPTLWEDNSPVNDVTASSKPILLAYSTGDTIPSMQGTRLKTQLVANGIDQRLLVYSGSLHGWDLIDSASPWAEIVTWFHRYLG